MSIQIARGASGDMSPVAPFSSAFGAGDCYCNDGQTLCPWYIESPSAQFSVGGDIKSCQDPDASRGFGVSGTTVSVPADAVLGLYHAYLQFEQDRTMEYYEFEVVCMTVEISATETHRDAATYKLSCTAEVSGGTAPYTYNWSGNVGDLLSGQGTATVEVEISVNDTGVIGVGVTDSDTSPCTASASFKVCDLICSFAPTLVSSPPVGQTGPYLYECEASVDGGTGPFTYEWSPSPDTLIEPDGQKVRISVPDDTRRQINLTVKDSDDCQSVYTQKVGTVTYTLEADPGDGTGTLHGERENAHFDVELTATADETILNAPYSLGLEFKRPATGEIYELTLDLEPNSSPTKYVGIWSDVTTMKGKWEIKVKNGNSNTVIFKIDKRQQIVDLASSWVGATSTEIDGNCNDLTAEVYSHLGIPLPGGDAGTQAQYNSAIIPCSGDGCLLFYSGVNAPAENVAHVAIAAGGQRININSNTTPGSPVVTEDINAGILSGAPNLYKAQIDSRSTVDLDED